MGGGDVCGKRGTLQAWCLFCLLPRLEGHASSASCFRWTIKQTLRGAKVLTASFLRSQNSWRNFDNCWIKYSSGAAKHGLLQLRIKLNYLSSFVYFVTTDSGSFFFHGMVNGLSTTKGLCVHMREDVHAWMCAHTRGRKRRTEVFRASVSARASLCICMWPAFILTYLMLSQDCEFLSLYL